MIFFHILKSKNGEFRVSPFKVHPKILLHCTQKNPLKSIFCCNFNEDTKKCNTLVFPFILSHRTYLDILPQQRDLVSKHPKTLTNNSIAMKEIFLFKVVVIN